MCPAGSIPNNPPINVFDFDPDDPLFSEPPNSLPNSRFPRYGQLQWGAYLNARLTLLPRLHLTTGLRFSRYAQDAVYDYLCTSIPAADPGYSPSCFGRQIGDVYFSTQDDYQDDDFSWPPPFSLSYDLTDALTAYVGYTSIYQGQANYRDRDLQPLDPMTGSNWEAGIKWGARGGKLNITLAAYRIRKKGFSVADPDFPFEQVGPGVYCCFIAGDDQTQQSQGLDFEIAGELSSGWQIAASHTYSTTELRGEPYGTSEGQPFTSIQPEHLYKLWTSYDFGAAGYRGLLDRFVLSAGLNGQSSAYYAGSVCVNFVGTPDPVTGSQDCASAGPPDFIDFAFRVPAYAIVSGRLDYRISDRWTLAINLDNILDRTYFQTVGQFPGAGNWYGAPRSATATLRAKW